MVPTITFVYITCRKECHFEWFISSLLAETIREHVNTNNIQIVLVDFHAPRPIECVGFANFIHTSPMPNPWQGPHRLTSRNHFSAAAARNTGIYFTRSEYVCFIDDTSVMVPGSLKHILTYAQKQLVVAFSYKKVYDLQVSSLGTIDNKREWPQGIDVRLGKGKPFRRISGSQLCGYAAMPLAVLLKVNGYDEITNGIGGEDYHLGIRLTQIGQLIYYSEHVQFFEAEDVCPEEPFVRRDPELTTEQEAHLRKQFNVTKRFRPLPHRLDVSHFILDLTTTGYTTRGNMYNLGALRKSTFNTKFDPNMKSLDGVFLRDL